ncbi:hypothetical protein JL721_3264 [Aureococcus anophagefferens]|nr:hypothetical protein JL721_3264 [Aureococcus anophagefferens]
MEAKVALWREVLAGTRHTYKTAMELYPQLHPKSFKDLPNKVARQPKSGPGRGGGSRDVKTYLASDVDALVARLAAPEPVEPRWREVEAGTRYTAKTAMERYPQLNFDSFTGLPSEIGRQPKIGKSNPRDVQTYLAADVDALVARLPARDQAVDPRWLEVAPQEFAIYTRLHRIFVALRCGSMGDPAVDDDIMGAPPVDVGALAPVDEATGRPATPSRQTLGRGANRLRQSLHAGAAGAALRFQRTATSVDQQGGLAASLEVFQERHAGGPRRRPPKKRRDPPRLSPLAEGRRA